MTRLRLTRPSDHVDAQFLLGSFLLLSLVGYRLLRDYAPRQWEKFLSLPLPLTFSFFLFFLFLFYQSSRNLLDPRRKGLLDRPILKPLRDMALYVNESFSKVLPFLWQSWLRHGPRRGKEEERFSWIRKKISLWADPGEEEWGFLGDSLALIWGSLPMYFLSILFFLELTFFPPVSLFYIFLLPLFLLTGLLRFLISLLIHHTLLEKEDLEKDYFSVRAQAQEGGFQYSFVPLRNMDPSFFEQLKDRWVDHEYFWTAATYWQGRRSHFTSLLSPFLFFNHSLVWLTVLGAQLSPLIFSP